MPFRKDRFYRGTSLVGDPRTPLGNAFVVAHVCQKICQERDVTRFARTRDGAAGIRGLWPGHTKVSEQQ